MGAICLYDQAVLWNVGGFVFAGVFVMVMEHLAVCLPSLVTMENAPPMLTYACILFIACLVVFSCVCLVLSSQYESMLSCGVFLFFECALWDI